MTKQYLDKFLKSFIFHIFKDINKKKSIKLSKSKSNEKTIIFFIYKDIFHLNLLLFELELTTTDLTSELVIGVILYFDMFKFKR